MKKCTEVFAHGSQWLKADFHLHTCADKEFKYNEDRNFFISKYIAQLKKMDIQIGVITNHNKFDDQEFKDLRKNAVREGIYLLPGVEFSVQNGSKGLHVLIVFDDAWIYNKEGKNYIAEFLTAAFFGKTSREGLSNYNLEQAYTALKSTTRDFFFVLAHVDEDKGLFEELAGGGLKELVASEAFRCGVLALQQLRKGKNCDKLEQLLGENMPACVEGSDHAEAGIDGIGCKQEQVYIKLGDYNFAALRYALKDWRYRIAAKPPQLEQAYVKRIHFSGKKIGEQTLCLSPSMNNFIGIRGSGKSSILEAIRYALEYGLPTNAQDHDYKEKLVSALLGSGGKICMDIVDRHGREFRTEKIMGEATNIYSGDERQEKLLVSSIIRTIYFGQKDLAEMGREARQEDLVEKLIRDKDKISDVKRRIEQCGMEIAGQMAEISKLEKLVTHKEALETRKAELETKLKLFQENEIDKKLNRQIEFDKDSNRLQAMITFARLLVASVRELWEEHKGAFDDYTRYVSKENPEIFVSVYSVFEKLQAQFNQLGVIVTGMETTSQVLTVEQQRLQEKYRLLQEEFSRIKREINLPNIEADMYVKLSKDMDITKLKLTEIEKASGKKKEAEKKLNDMLAKLQGLWHEQFKLVEMEIVSINNAQTTIRIETVYKGNKEIFKAFLREHVRGSGLREAVLDKVVAGYMDMVEVYRDIISGGIKLRELVGDAGYHTLEEKLQEKRNVFLTYRVPDQYRIYYKDKPLQDHSLGQRASALVIFILSLKDEQDLIIIDQPEDDLDNQTIYEDVIKLLRQLKYKTQFIFATHNPNIPVLGDCEQVFSCLYMNEKISVENGNVDVPSMQEKIINIMEGGQEAFARRGRIYETWKH